MQFENFIGFCDFFFFTNSFVNMNYDVIRFEEICENNKFRPNKYLVFMENNIKAINRRNKEIEKFLQNASKY